MKHYEEELLDKAIKAIQAAEPDTGEISASSTRMAHRLGVAMNEELMTGIIESCEDVQHMLHSYRAGTLSNARALLVKAHLRDCGQCTRAFQSSPQTAAVDWSTPSSVRASRSWRPQSLRLAFGLALSILACGYFLYRAYWEVPPGVRAEVQSINGSAYLIASASERPLLPGVKLREGEQLRTAAGSRAVLRLSDGSTVEVNERSVLGVGARGHNMTVSLDGGAVIVQAVKRTSGHLYVKTPDCRVAVTGTVFSVNSGIKGSRVAVLQGNVQVLHSGINTLLHAGDQVATSTGLTAAPLSEQVAWSQDRDKYLELAAQLAMLQHRIGGIPFPQTRYNSDLLPRVPTQTLLYISIPNLGDFLKEANTIFHDQLNQSPALQQWWNRGHGNNTAELDALVNKLHDVSQYLGDEVVIVGVRQADHPAFAILADVQKSGLDSLLREQFASTDSKGSLVVLDESALNTVAGATTTKRTAYALIREHEAIFSNDIATLKTLDVQLHAGDSGFISGDFGKQIEAAYSRGAGIILAADLHSMLNQNTVLHMPQAGNRALGNSGLEDVQYLIAEHRETNGTPENHLNVQFAGERQHVASWLAKPAPMESLNFVSPNASFAVAALSKDPKMIADDILSMATSGSTNEKAQLSQTEAEVQTLVRDDLMANLGGEFVLALDGPVLPTPSWKAVIEVHDPDRVEQALEHLTQIVDDQDHGKDFHAVHIETSVNDGQRFYAVRDMASGAMVAQYTFSSGFMIMAPDRSVLMDALQTHANGNSLARSSAFRTLLPKDDNENYSAIAYQNLSPVLTPLLSQMSGESADAVRKLAADSRPTAICAWGKESRIEAASDSSLFGFDFLTLGTLLNSRNQPANQHVRD